MNQTVAPRPPSVKLGPLVRVDLDEFLAADGDDLDEVEVRDVQVEDLRWAVRRRITSSVVSGLRTPAWRARGLTVNESRLENLDVVALSAVEAGWRQVEVRASRIGSAELFDADFRQVAFVGCKLGFVNLRGAKLTDLTFTDCVIEELDLMRATATRVAFGGCRIGRLELAGSRLVDVDLRASELAGIGDPAGLRGVTIGPDQLIDFGPVLAAGLGMRVE